MSSEYTVTAEDRARFDEMVRTQLKQEPQPPQSPARTIGLWLLLIILFIGFYRLFGKAETQETPVTTDSRVVLVCALGLVVGLVAFGAGVLRGRASPQGRRSTGPATVLASMDGVEFRMGTRTTIFRWAGITQVMESEELVAFLQGKLWQLIPLRAFTPEERVQFLEALRQRTSSRPPLHVESARYEFTLTAQHKSEAHRAARSWWMDKVAQGLLFGGVLLVTCSSAPLAVTVHAIFGLVTVLGFLTGVFAVRQLLGLRKAESEVVTLMLGEEIRLLGSVFGAAFSWSDVTSWGETQHLLILQMPANYGALLREALPHQALEFLQARLAHTPRADR